MDHKNQDIFVCIRNRDHAGLAEWLLSLLEMANEDAQRGLTGVMRYDGSILVPLLQLGDVSFSKALLSDPRVRKAMTDKSVQHDDWLLNLAVKDPCAWLLALDHGWGQVLTPRPSMLRALTVGHMFDKIQEYLLDPKRVAEDKIDVAWGQGVWDAWMRVATARNPSLITHMHAPSREELLQVMGSPKPLWFRPNMWPALEKACPGFLAMHQEAQAIHAGLGIPFGTLEQKQVLARALGIAPTEAPETIAMEFEPGH